MDHQAVMWMERDFSSSNSILEKNSVVVIVDFTFRVNFMNFGCNPNLGLPVPVVM